MRGDQFEENPERSKSSKQNFEWPRTSIDHVMNEKTSMLSPARPIFNFHSKEPNQEKKSPRLLIRSAIESTEAGLQIEACS